MSEVQAEAPVASENDAPVENVEGSTPSPAEQTESKEQESQSRVEKRINKLTWEKHEAERRAREAESKLQESQTAKPDPVSAIADIPVPNYADFGTDAEFNQAMQQYNAQAFTRLQEQTQSQAEAQRAESEKTQRRQAYQAKVSAFADSNDDFVKAVSESNIVLNNDVTDLLVDSEKAAELTYWLAQNAEAAIRLNDLSPVQAARELGRIEASLDAVVPKKVSDAPTPMSDLTGSDTADSVLRDDMDMDDWLKKRRSQLREKGRR